MINKMHTTILAQIEHVPFSLKSEVKRDGGTNVCNTSLEDEQMGITSTTETSQEGHYTEITNVRRRQHSRSKALLSIQTIVLAVICILRDVTQTVV